MGLTWAVGWAGVGVLIGVSSILLPGLPWDLFFGVFDAPLPALGIPGFVGGAAFSAILGVAGRRRRFDELSLTGFVACGAIGGLTLGLLPVVLTLTGGTPSGSSLGQLVVAWTVPVAALGAVSAAGSLVLARRAEDRDLIAAGEDIPGAALREGDAPEPLGGRG